MRALQFPVLALLATSPGAVRADDRADWEPLLTKYCFECHDSDAAKGGIDLGAALERPLAESGETWERALRQLQGRVMPPAGKPRPKEPEYNRLGASLIAALDAHAAEYPDPGRNDTLRRLTRTQYQNTIRDLLEIEVDARTLLPPDSPSHGFDNVTVGDLPPALLDRYISAAEKISALALGRIGDTPDGRTVRIRPDLTQEGHVEGLPLGTRGGVLIRHLFPRDGDYDIRIHLMRDRDEKVEGLRGVHRLEVLLDGEVAAEFQVRPPKNSADHTKVDAHLSARIPVKAGARELGVTFVAPPADLVETLRQPYQSAFNTHRHPRRAPAVYQVSITGPFNPESTGDTASRRRLLEGIDERDAAGAERVLRRFLRRAYRGRDDDADLARMMTFYRAGSAEGAGFDAGLQAAVAAALVSPKFLFHIEKDPADAEPGSPYELGGLELASRLSFFLWSSTPDDELLQAAAAGSLADPDEMERQARRLLADPRAASLATNFASQWLYLRKLDEIQPDGRLFPDFDDNLRQSMRRETELYFESVLRDQRSTLDLLESDYTFLNERLAKHYGVPHVYGERMRRVSLMAGDRYGGIPWHGSVLTVTSYANRTSPVLRGAWVLENLLGTPPPPPPPDIPALEDASVDASLPVRERLAVHRENPSCAHCHAAMDPLGFAFEYYDAVGRWRWREGEARVDASGAMPDGTRFDGPATFGAALLQRPELFVRTLTEKLLVYALGRGIEPSDAPMVRAIVRGAGMDDYRLSGLLLQIVRSDLFRTRMTEAPEPDANR